MTSPLETEIGGEAAAAQETASIVSVVLDGAGGGRSDAAAAAASGPGSPASWWTIIRGTSADTQRWLTIHGGLSPEGCRALLDPPRRAWVSRVDRDTWLAALQTFPDGRDPGWLRLVRAPHRLITITDHPLPALDTALERLRAGRGARSLAQLMVDMAVFALDRVSIKALAFDAATADLEYELDVDKGPPPLDRLRDLRKDTTLLRRQLARHREAMEQLDSIDRGANAGPILGAEEERWRRMLRNADDLVELVDGIVERLRALDDYLQNHLSAVLNDRLYVLTLISAIVLPLSFITGLLGVNVGGIPLRDTGWGFVALCTFLALLATGQYALIRRLRWLPRQSRPHGISPKDE